MPEPVVIVNGLAAALPIENVDTDMIWPSTPGSTLKRGDQARIAFHRLRFDADGAELPEFVLNREPWRHARILVSGDNFGCGSSREMAVWALHEWGLRCVIAPRFGDIFYNNCCLNGLLPIRLDKDVVAHLMGLASDPVTATMTVDLTCCVVRAGGQDHPFAIEERARRCLLEGLDLIGMTLGYADTISAFGNSYFAKNSWTNGSAKSLVSG
jgi:3-isopropylmalate/(R)-2-methylmalate dehydratase small subunit